MEAAVKAVACAWCGGGAQPFVLDADGDLVCAPGRGCSRHGRGRAAPVARTRVERMPPPAASIRRTRERCACGRVEGDPTVWLDLVGRELLLTCPSCVEVAR